MKRILITQYGSSLTLFSREMIVEVPDGVDLDSLSDTELEDRGDEAGIEWVWRFTECAPTSDRNKIEDVDPSEYGGIPVIRYNPEEKT